MTHPAEWIGRSPAIARVNNAEAERWEEDTDLEQIVLLYGMLLHLAAPRVTRLHRAIAVRYAAGAAGGALRGSVQYREGARAGQIRERRENGEADGQRILRGDDLVAHEVTQGVGGSAPRRPQPLQARFVTGRPALEVVREGADQRLGGSPAGQARRPAGRACRRRCPGTAQARPGPTLESRLPRSPRSRP